jgi:hypothetical protein
MNAEPESCASNTTPLSIEELTDLVKESIISGVGENPYIADEAPQYVQSIVQTVLNALTSRKTGCKYVVNVSLVQNTGAGIHHNTGAIWNADTDEFVTVPFTTDHLHVICTICQLKMRTLPPLLADEL